MAPAEAAGEEHPVPPGFSNESGKEAQQTTGATKEGAGTRGAVLKLHCSDMPEPCPLRECCWLSVFQCLFLVQSRRSQDGVGHISEKLTCLVSPFAVN